MTTMTNGHREQLDALEERRRAAKDAENEFRKQAAVAREVGDKEGEAIASDGVDGAIAEQRLVAEFKNQILSRLTGVRPRGQSLTQDMEAQARLN